MKRETAGQVSADEDTDIDRDSKMDTQIQKDD